MNKKHRHPILQKMEGDNGTRPTAGGGQSEEVPEERLQRLYDDALALSDRDALAAKAAADDLYDQATRARNGYWQGMSRYLAGFCMYNLSEYDRAMQEFDRGSQIARDRDIPALDVKFCNAYGAIFSRLGQYPRAIEQFAAGLRKAREMGKRRDEIPFLVNLGEASLLMGDCVQALSFELEAREIVNDLELDSVYAVDLNYNLGEAQARCGKTVEAEASYRRSLDAAIITDNKISEVEARVRLGAILAGRDQQVEGLAMVEQALQLCRSCEFPLQEVASLLACGRIEMTMGRLVEAEAHFREAVDLADSHKMGDQAPSALESLAAARAAMGRSQDAYSALMQSVEAARALSGVEASRKLAELTSGFRLENAKREAEIERIRRQELESANAHLRTVARIGQSLTQSLEPKDILRRMWDELSSIIDLNGLGFGVYSADSGVIEFPGLMSDGVLQPASSVFLTDEFSLAALCVRERRILHFQTSSEALDALRHSSLVTFSGQPPTQETILYLPLYREDDIMGVLTVQSRKDHAYTEDTVEMLRAVASFTAIAVENAQIMIRLNAANRIISGQKEEVEKAALASSWLAEHDSLTGLPNRRFLERVLDENIRLAAMEGKGIAVFFIDLDNLKRVNDDCGHGVGDRLLVAVAQRLVSAFREGDYVARVGGDEFVVVAPGLRNTDNVASIAAKAVASFEEPFVVGDRTISMGISLGAALYPQHGGSGQELIRRADDAMYLIKGQGKGAWQIWQSAVPEK